MYFTNSLQVAQTWDLLERPLTGNRASQVVLVVKNSAANAGDLRDAGLIPGWGRSPGKRHGNPLQDSCLENPMDRGAWWATIRGVTESDTTTVTACMHVFYFFFSFKARLILDSSEQCGCIMHGWAISDLYQTGNFLIFWVCTQDIKIHYSKIPPLAIAT